DGPGAEPAWNALRAAETSSSEICQSQLGVEGGMGRGRTSGVELGQLLVDTAVDFHYLGRRECLHCLGRETHPDHTHAPTEGCVLGGRLAGFLGLVGNGFSQEISKPSIAP